MSNSFSALALHRTVWRWHFYAGLVVAPFMFILAVTGAIYLFNDEINDVLHRDLRIVAPVSEPAPLSKMAEAAITAYPGGKVTRIDTARATNRSVEVFVTPATGDAVRVFVDPGTGRVLGSYVYARTLVGFADIAHGSLTLGSIGDNIVELAACWGFILVATGLYLWWPRGRFRLGGVLYPRIGRRGRPFWKEWHAVVGMWSAFLIMFLILTGLPWASFWGDLLRRGTDLAGIGYPANHRLQGTTPSTTTVKDAAGNAAPWTLEQAPIPDSDPHAGHHGHITSAPAAKRMLGVDDVAAILTREGLMAPYRLILPKNASGVFTAFSYPDQPETQRTLHVDQYSGRVIGDVRFADYGWAAKAVELGVQIHMGNYFGRLNQIVMLIPCIGIIVLTITGPLMWWRRRPKGEFAAPQPLSSPRLRTSAMIVIGLCVMFPLAGASLALAMIADWVWEQSPAYRLRPGQ
ncbi:propeptide, PepSY amd peptidase M4 [Nitrobacter winogradskyi Nb-255]|uniref:Propeptide, PepSY amd peptidase M4 n=1 Tax=Nitrobacter winogradskyi (strain ATCC 25391 / DSM 10237 / CIP 104748 / NCIMB 11846 / Nb-255) TaxID=323098 RepID=Q3SQ68_NITWN|nr:PepSY domain-containing protein [Nitrobacter winogradskyi]ABA05573.1 propeptide, PepSY amd peptidase M4 [Nitrobacter winogradskyi Nb-255]